MPPKPKFTREEIIAAALELVSQSGMEAMTSRNLGAKLNSSARPIFTVFKNMEELTTEVKKAAMQQFEAYVNANPDDAIPVFKRFGIRMVRFSIEQPKLFQLLFMAENDAAKSFEDVSMQLGRVATTSIEVLHELYGLTEPQAQFLFRQLWIYTFGLGVMCSAKVCSFTESDISNMLTQTFTANYMLLSKEQTGTEPLPPAGTGWIQKGENYAF